MEQAKASAAKSTRGQEAQSRHFALRAQSRVDSEERSSGQQTASFSQLGPKRPGSHFLHSVRRESLWSLLPPSRLSTYSRHPAIGLDLPRM